MSPAPADRATGGAHGRGGHALIVPDGNRRHARRQFLRDLRADSSADLSAALSRIPRDQAARIERRIAGLARDEVDRLGPHADELDCDHIPVPLSYLLKSYAVSGELIDRLIRRLSATDLLSSLSIYAMQRSNLHRKPREIEAFLRVEAAFQQRWAEDEALLERVRFRFVGDRSALTSLRGGGSLEESLSLYLESARRLERACRGDVLVVHLLAPYDHVWEINGAIRDGVFSPERLAVSEEVDVVMRFGGQGRSVASGALPCQTAFSRFRVVDRYFPDCSLEEVMEGLSAGLRQPARRGR